MSPTPGELVAWIAETLRSCEMVRPEETIAIESRLLGRGIGLDSIEVLQIVAAAEEEFDLTLGDDELTPEHFRTVGTLAAFLEDKLDG